MYEVLFVDVDSGLFSVPHSQFENGARLHLCMNEQTSPNSERRQLVLSQNALGKLKPISKRFVPTLF